MINEFQQVKMMENQECKYICNKKFDSKQVDDFKWMIDRDYHYTYFVDDLPSAYVSS